MSRSTAGDIVGGIEFLLLLVLCLALAVAGVSVLDAWMSTKKDGLTDVASSAGNVAGSAAGSAAASALTGGITSAFQSLSDSVHNAFNFKGDSSSGLDFTGPIQSPPAGDPAAVYSQWLIDNPDAPDAEKAGFWAWLNGYTQGGS